MKISQLLEANLTETKLLEMKKISVPVVGKSYGASDTAAPKNTTPAQLSRVLDILYAAQESGLKGPEGQSLVDSIWGAIPKEVKGDFNYAKWKYSKYGLSEGLLNEQRDISQKNLDAVMTVMKFDGDIPLHNDGSKAGKESQNQCDKLIKEGEFSLWYVALDKPHADIEAYVVSSDKNGKVSYVDFKHRDFVIDDKLQNEKIHSDDEETLMQWIEEFKVEGGHPTAGCIKAFNDMIKKFN